MPIATIIAALILGLAAGCGVGPRAAEADADRPAPPAAVEATVASLFGGTRASIHADREGGREVYEAAVPTRLEAVIDPGGALIATEIEVPPASLPDPVAAAVRAHLPAGARVTEAEVVLERDRVTFEVEARTATGTVELVVDASGKVLDDHPDDDDGPDDDDDDDDHDDGDHGG